MEYCSALNSSIFFSKGYKRPFLCFLHSFVLQGELRIMREIDEDFVNRSLCSVERMSSRRFFCHCKEIIGWSLNGLVMIRYSRPDLPGHKHPVLQVSSQTWATASPGCEFIRRHKSYVLMTYITRLGFSDRKYSTSSSSGCWCCLRKYGILTKHLRGHLRHHVVENTVFWQSTSLDISVIMLLTSSSTRKPALSTKVTRSCL